MNKKAEESQTVAPTATQGGTPKNVPVGDDDSGTNPLDQQLLSQDGTPKNVPVGDDDSGDNTLDQQLTSQDGTPKNVPVGDDDTGGDPHDPNKPRDPKTKYISPSKMKKYFNLKGVDRDTLSLHQFLDTIKPLTHKERETIIDQAVTLMEQVYVHLPLKQAMHAVSPQQRLKLLKHRNTSLSERGFHKQMISIFTELRDLHTRYILPEPYSKMVAFLPFLIESYYEGNERKYMISKLFAGVETEVPTLKPGTRITHWNGVRIDLAIENNGDRNPGSNEHARHARGIERMTIRPLMMALPPDEDWVNITYINQEGHTETIRFIWWVTMPKEPKGNGSQSEDNKVGSSLGLDRETELVRRVKKPLFSPSAQAHEQNMAPFHPQEGKQAKAAPNSDKISVLPDVFRFSIKSSVGYIRIYSFNVDDAGAFLSEFTRILDLLPKEGLIIDLRANAGGLIPAGELILQALTDQKIQKERLHFINSPLMLKLCRQHEWLSQWAPSIEGAIETGSIFSQGFHLEPEVQYPEDRVGYPGPIVLITDALCYSTTDIFAAGFSDHKLGTILGIAGNTGAGGANAWSYKLLRKLMGEGKGLHKLPRKADFSIAIRRTTRVGDNTGMPLEDLGVKPDVIHRTTRRDLLENNVDLITKAVGIIADKNKEKETTKTKK